MPSFSSAILRLAGVRGPNKARWISSELKRPARRTTILLPSSSHSKIEPGPMPSFLRTSTGTEICPCAVSLDRAIAIPLNYQGMDGLFLIGVCIIVNMTRYRDRRERFFGGGVGDVWSLKRDEADGAFSWNAA